MQRKVVKMKKEAMANDYKILCAEANEMVKQKNGAATSNGWTKIDGKYDKSSNFKGVLYEKNGEYAICFVGTDKWSYKDHAANLKMAITGDSRQIRTAKRFAENMIQEHSLNKENTVSIGHSEGGTEATAAGINNNFQTVTFNAYGIGKTQLEANKNYDDLVTNYRDPHDPVSKLRANVGKTYITPSPQNQFMSKTPFGSIQAHGIKHMGDCNNAVPVNYYKKTHPMFIDKISEKNISPKDIGQMESDLFKAYEKEIDNRMANGAISKETSMQSEFSKYLDIQNANKNANTKNSEKISHITMKSQSPKTSSSGKWVTINGNHVFVKN